MYKLNEREVQIDGVHGTMNEEILIDEAIFTDNGEVLSDEQVDNIIEMYYDELNEHLLMRAVCAAESYFEGDR